MRILYCESVGAVSLTSQLVESFLPAIIRILSRYELF